MTGENRVLAYFGLQVINSDPRPGIKAGSSSKKTNLRYRCCFIIAPRMLRAHQHGNHAVELLNLILNRHSNLLRNRTIQLRP
jgi:single-stranded-DNA-specific exonuclease